MGIDDVRSSTSRVRKASISKFARPRAGESDRPQRQHARSAQPDLQQHPQRRGAQQPPLLHDRCRRLPRAQGRQLKTLALATLERVIREGKQSNSNRCCRANARSCISRWPIVGRAHRIRGRRPDRRLVVSPKIEIGCTRRSRRSRPRRGAVRSRSSGSGPYARAHRRARLRGRAPLADRVATYGEILDVDGAGARSAAWRWRWTRHALTRARTSSNCTCTGSPVVARETLRALLAAGATRGRSGGVTRRAFLNGQARPERGRSGGRRDRGRIARRARAAQQTLTGLTHGDRCDRHGAGAGPRREVPGPRGGDRLPRRGSPIPERPGRRPSGSPRRATSSSRR